MVSFRIHLNIPYHLLTYLLGGFGGLEVACWPLVPKFAGSKPAEIVELSGQKNPHFAYLRHVKEPESVCVVVAAFGRNYRPFPAKVVPPFTTRVFGGDTWRCK